MRSKTLCTVLSVLFAASLFLGSDLYDELENIKANPVPFGGNEFFQPLGGEAAARFF